MQKSITKRIRITKNKKVIRRATTLGHSRANKSSTQMQRKKHTRGIVLPFQTVQKYFHNTV